jgi:hypothetical protein
MVLSVAQSFMAWMDDWLDGWANKSDSFTDFYTTLIFKITLENCQIQTLLKKRERNSFTSICHLIV